MPSTLPPAQAGAPAPTKGLFLPISFPFPSCAEAKDPNCSPSSPTGQWVSIYQAPAVCQALL